MDLLSSIINLFLNCELFFFLHKNGSYPLLDRLHKMLGEKSQFIVIFVKDRQF